MYIFTEVTQEDGEIFDSWLKHENVKEWMSGIEDWFKYFEFANSEPDYFLIKFLFENKIIGVIMLEITGETGSIAIIINPDEQNKGHGKKILNLFLREINKIINRTVKSIYAGILPDNIASKRCFESCGFELKGIDEDGFMEYVYSIKYV